MIDIINGKAYLKVGDKVYELGGGSNIITADSVEQLPDPATVPEGTIALVPSEGESGGGLEVVELTTTIGNGTMLTESESAALTAAWEKGASVIIKCNIDFGTGAMSIDNLSGAAMIGTMTKDKQGNACEMRVFGMPFGSTIILFCDASAMGLSGWMGNLEST